MYRGARYYNSQLGQFISRDPLGYVDGMSQYRAYFVPGAMDPTGKLYDDREIKDGKIAKGDPNPSTGGSPVAPKAGCCHVYLWLPQAFNEVGHAAVHCNSFYVSFWPASGGTKKGSDPSTWHNYSQDEQAEGRAPDETIELCCLNQTKMAAVLATLQKKNSNFECIGQNCSTMSGAVLFGGVDTSKPTCSSREKLHSCFNQDGSVAGIDKPSNIRKLANCLKRRKCKSWACVPDGKYHPPTDRADPCPWGHLPPGAG